MRPYLILVLVSLLLYLPGMLSRPVTDRDEALFAQSSRQMFLAKQYFSPYFLHTPRYKKPIGIYWLQIIAAKVFGVSDRIWIYRLPSLLGALGSVLLLFGFTKRLFGEKCALLSGLLLECSVLLLVEAQLATTDAVLLFFTVAAQTSLGLIYLNREYAFSWIVFWSTLALGTLIKGPVLPLLCLLTFVTLILLSYRSGELAWIKKLHLVVGPLLFLVCVAPWFTYIHLHSDGAFWSGFFLEDIWSKLISSQESHGFPPGFYAVLASVCFFPGVLFLPKTVRNLRASMQQGELRFFLAWLLPMWLFFELAPTKLPHYVLPLYPALSILVAKEIEQLGYVALKNFFLPYAVLALLGTAVILPNLESLWLARSIAKSLSTLKPGTQVLVAGFNEPSMAFELGGELRFVTATEAAKLLAPGKVAVITSELQSDFENAPTNCNAKSLQSQLTGFNYVKAKWVTVFVYYCPF